MNSAGVLSHHARRTAVGPSCLIRAHARPAARQLTSHALGPSGTHCFAWPCLPYKAPFSLRARLDDRRYQRQQQLEEEDILGHRVGEISGRDAAVRDRSERGGRHSPPHVGQPRQPASASSANSTTGDASARVIGRSISCTIIHRRIDDRRIESNGVRARRVFLGREPLHLAHADSAVQQPSESCQDSERVCSTQRPLERSPLPSRRDARSNRT